MKKAIVAGKTEKIKKITVIFPSAPHQLAVLKQVMNKKEPARIKGRSIIKKKESKKRAVQPRVYFELAGVATRASRKMSARKALAARKYQAFMASCFPRARTWLYILPVLLL